MNANHSTPITFALTHLIPKPAAQICAEVADVTRWREFTGYGILPGIERAVYEVRTENMIGSRVRAHNTDGSQHVEDITEWVAGQRIVMRMHDFTPTLSRLATHFIETWTFDEGETGTLVTRSFQLFPQAAWTRPPLWGISLLFRRAIGRQLGEMAVTNGFPLD